MAWSAVLKVVVTGGAGFIGANACRTLLRLPSVTHVTVLDDLSTGTTDNLEGVDVELLVGSVTHTQDVSAAISGASAVVHLAALPSVPRSIKAPTPSHTVNVLGTLVVLEAAREQGAQVITASSSSVYGANPELPKSEKLAPRPLSPYAATKLAAESYTLAWGHSYGMDVLAFRFFNVYGPFQRAGHPYAAVIPRFLEAALRNEPLSIYGDGTQTRDFTFVSTVTDVIATAVANGTSHLAPVNLALGARSSINDLVRTIEDVIGQPLSTSHHDPRRSDVHDSQADASTVQRLFGPIEPVELQNGLTETLRWFVEATQGRDA